jgi:hypothetical protein
LCLPSFADRFIRLLEGAATQKKGLAKTENHRFFGFFDLFFGGNPIFQDFPILPVFTQEKTPEKFRKFLKTVVFTASAMNLPRQVHCRGSSKIELLDVFFKNSKHRFSQILKISSR